MSSPIVQISYYTIQVGLTIFRIDSRYQNVSFMGEGSYGCVVSAFDIKNNRYVAIKKLSDPLSKRESIKSLQREVKLLNHFHGHENVVAIYDIMVDPPDAPEFEDIYIVTNLYETTLNDVIKSNQALAENHYQYLLYQTLRALKYIHSANIIHRNLKPSNVLVNSTCDLAISDFGQGRCLDNFFGIRDPLTQDACELHYRAPELLCDCKEYGKPVDIWAVGCIFSELITRTTFFRGETPSHQLKIILNKIDCPNDKEQLSFIKNQSALNTVLKYRGEIKCVPNFGYNFPDGASYPILDLLKKMLHFNPDERITVEEALQHPFLKTLHNQTPEPICSFMFNQNNANMSQLETMARQIVMQNQYQRQLYMSRVPKSLSVSTSPSSDNGSSSSASDTCHLSIMDMDNIEGSADKDTLIAQNMVIDELMKNDVRTFILQEVMKYRPVSQEMMMYLVYGSNKSSLIPI